MKIISTFLIIATLTFSLSAQAAQPSVESVQQLLKLSKADKLMDSVLTQMNGMIEASMKQASMGKQLNVKQQAIIEQQQAKMIATAKEELNWDKMAGSFVQVYRQTFTQDEVNGLITFYKSPVGQSFVEKQPELMKNTSAVIQQHMGPMMQQIRQMAEETAKELQAAKTDK